jgi:hypothetical protein
MTDRGLFDFLNHWWNLPYLVMLGLVAVFFVLQMLGMLGGGGHHDADVSTDTDVDADVDHDVDVDADHDIDADHDVDADHDADTPDVTWQVVLSFFGLGRVPIMVVWVTLFIFTGFTGIFVNSSLYVNHDGTYPGWGLAASLGIALAVGLVAVRLFSRIAARFVDIGGWPRRCSIRPR